MLLRVKIRRPSLYGIEKISFIRRLLSEQVVDCMLMLPPQANNCTESENFLLLLVTEMILSIPGMPSYDQLLPFRGLTL